VQVRSDVENLGLPLSDVCASIDVQHLSRYLVRLCQIANSIDNVLDIHDTSNRRPGFQEIFGVILCIGVSMTPGATAFTLIPSLAYSIARLRVIASSPPLVTDASTPEIRC
jgi:hypothetical protein